MRRAGRDTPVVVITTTRSRSVAAASARSPASPDGTGVIQPLLTTMELLAHDRTDDAHRLIILADAALDAVVTRLGAAVAAPASSVLVRRIIEPPFTPMDPGTRSQRDHKPE